MVPPAQAWLLHLVAQQGLALMGTGEKGGRGVGLVVETEWGLFLKKKKQGRFLRVDGL